MSGAARPHDRGALAEALRRAAETHGRLSDEEVKALRRRRRATIGAGGAVAASLALVALVALVALRIAVPASAAEWQREIATAPGEARAVRLADGSRVRLDGATRVRFAYRADRRSATLVAGQAFFDIRHDPARPFAVHTALGEARVLGTAFDLDLTRAGVDLSVFRGAVGFGAAGSARQVTVRAGYRSRASGGAVTTPTAFDAREPDWRQGWITADAMRIDALVEVLARTGGATVAPPPAAIAALTVSGRFRTDRPGTLLTAIGAGYGFRVEPDGAGLRLVPDRGAR